MLIYIVRHAKAERDAPTGRDDDRPLAPAGIRQAEFLGDVFAHPRPPIGDRPTRILTSPAERAAKTAALIAAATGLEPTSESSLAPDSSYGQVLRVLRRAADGGSPTILVGHNPVFEELVLNLTAGQSGAPEHLRTGELVVLDVVAGTDDLRARFVARARLAENPG